MKELPRREPDADEKALMEKDLKDQMQRVANIQKGEIWELEVGRYKVIKAFKSGKIIHLRRI